MIKGHSLEESIEVFVEFVPLKYVDRVTLWTQLRKCGKLSRALRRVS
jgi:hypothetical protein